MDFALALSPIHHPSGLQKDFRVGKSVLEISRSIRSMKLDFETETLYKFPTKSSLKFFFEICERSTERTRPNKSQQLKKYSINFAIPFNAGIFGVRLRNDSLQVRLRLGKTPNPLSVKKTCQPIRVAKKSIKVSSLGQ